MSKLPVLCGAALLSAVAFAPAVLLPLQAAAVAQWSTAQASRLFPSAAPQSRVRSIWMDQASPVVHGISFGQVIGAARSLAYQVQRQREPVRFIGIGLQR